jgi:hypothetical protein
VLISEQGLTVPLRTAVAGGGVAFGARPIAGRPIENAEKTITEAKRIFVCMLFSPQFCSLSFLDPALATACAIAGMVESHRETMVRDLATGLSRDCRSNGKLCLQE